MRELDLKYQQDPFIFSREIAGEVILLPLNYGGNGMESIYTLNETAATVWTMLDGEHTLAEIRDTIMKEFSVDATIAETDILNVVKQLEAIGAIQKS